MNRANQIQEDGERRRNTVGFALQILQRRLASSPAANGMHEPDSSEVVEAVWKSGTLTVDCPRVGKDEQRAASATIAITVDRTDHSREEALEVIVAETRDRACNVARQDGRVFRFGRFGRRCGF
jgi:hypothetical protein